MCAGWPGKGGDASLTATSLCKMLFPIETLVESDGVGPLCLCVRECLSKSLLNLLQVVIEKRGSTRDISIDNVLTAQRKAAPCKYNILLYYHNHTHCCIYFLMEPRKDSNLAAQQEV